jgi:hypothetical protein
MAVSMNVDLRNARADQITSFAGNSAIVRIYTAGYAGELADCVCGTPLAPAAAGGTLTFNAFTPAATTGAGVAAIARLYKSDGVTMVMEGLTVAESGANINLSTTTIASGDELTITSATITEGNP